MTGKELYYISQAHFHRALSGDGPFTKICQSGLENNTGANKELLTRSCTATLKMDAILADKKRVNNTFLCFFQLLMLLY